MRIKKILPSLLKKEIKYIYVFEGSADADYGAHAHLPDGTFDLVFSFGKMQRKDDADYYELPETRVVGGYTKAFTLTYPRDFTVIAIVFNPLYVSSFVPQIYDISSENCVRAEVIFGDEIWELRNKLETTQHLGNAVISIENFLLRKKLSLSSYHSKQIGQALHLMDHGATGIASISREIGMSERNFRRIFKDLTGFTPRKMLQLKRVKKLSRMLSGSGDLHNAVVSLGYYDASHMIHDFKSISGTTPYQYSANLDRIDQAFHYWN